MNSNLFWCIIGIVGGAIFSLLISLFFYLLGLKRKHISYYIETFCIISNKVNQIADLEIKYHNNKLPYLYLSKIVINNSGNSIIEYQDFPTSYIPVLYTDGKFIINNTFISELTANNQKDDFKIIYNDIDTNKITLSFDYLAKNEKIILSFFHTGNISFNAKLKDGKITQISEETKYEAFTHKTVDIISRLFYIWEIILIIYAFINHNILSAILIIGITIFVCIIETIPHIIDKKDNSCIPN